MNKKFSKKSLNHNQVLNKNFTTYKVNIELGHYITYELHIDNLVYYCSRGEILSILNELKVKIFKRVDKNTTRLLTNLYQFVNHIDRFSNDKHQIFIEIVDTY